MMSGHTITALWMSEADYARKDVRAIMDAAGYTDEEYDGDLVFLQAFEKGDPYDTFERLHAMGVPFFAHSDSRREPYDGVETVWASYKKRRVSIREDGAGRPVVTIHRDGRPHPEDLRAARLYWLLHDKVGAYAAARAATKKEIRRKGKESERT